MSHTHVSYSDQHFGSLTKLLKGSKETVFDQCLFRGVDFTNFDFRGCQFAGVAFEDCNFSMVKFGFIVLDDVHFKDCKLMGADFTKINDFVYQAQFTNCVLDYATWQQKKQKKTVFTKCSLKDADFSEADFSDSIFDMCNLHRAVFEGTRLLGADFTTAYDFDIDPDKNQLRKARFSRETLSGLLQKYDLTII